MDNIRLCYFGASGGFLLLHLLLLDGRLHCKFKNTSDQLEEIINKQWNISDHKNWKDYEYWPDNRHTQKIETQKQKIYFFCNDTIEKISNFDGKVVFIYTDAKSQLELAHYKHAWMYGILKNYSSISYYKSFMRAWQKHYTSIKDPSWPMCYGPNKLAHVDPKIQQEVLSNKHTHQHLNFPSYSSFLKNTRMIPGINHYTDNIKKMSNGVEVLAPVADFFQYADVAVKLQDIVNNLSILSQITHALPNQQQVNLKNMWVSLHTDELLNQIGINKQ